MKVAYQQRMCNAEMLNKEHIKGKVGELFALLYLLLKGYKPIALNDKTGGIESDLIAVKGQNIIICEVKWRKNQAKAHQAIHPNQRERLKRKLRVLQKTYPDKNLSIHLMLICPTPPFIEHITNPF